MKRVIDTIAVLAALGVAVALPAAYFVPGYAGLAAAGEVEAAYEADRIEQVIAIDPDMWRFQDVRLRDILDHVRRDPPGRAHLVRVLDARGNVVVEVGTALPAPVLTSTRALYDAGRAVGRLEHSVSLRGLWVGTGLVALVGLALGAAVLVALRVVPQRALQRATADLEASHAELAAAGDRLAVLVGERTALLASLLDNVPVAVFMKEVESRRYVLWNRWTARLYGYAQEEAIGRTADELFPPETAAILGRADDEAIASGGLVVGERRLTVRDGREIATLSHKVAVRDATGKIAYVLGMALDMTDRKVLEASLARRDAILEAVAYGSARFLQAGAEASDVQWQLAVGAVLTQLGEATGVSRVWVAENVRAPSGEVALRVAHRWVREGFALPEGDPVLTQALSYHRDGLEVEALRLRRGEVLELKPRDLPEPVRERFARLRIRSQQRAPIDCGGEWWGFIAFDDCVEERSWSEVEVDALRTAANLFGAALAARSSREQLRRSLENLGSVVARLRRQGAEVERQNVELERASRMKSEFLAAVTHELRTPLNAILGFADLLEAGLAGPVSGAQKSMAGEILGAGRQLLALVNRLLELAQLDAGRLPIAPEPTDLGLLLRQVAAANAVAAKTRGIDIAVAGDEGEADVDPRLWRRLLDELVGNAVKFSQDGGRVTLAARREGEAVVIDVTDSGSGMDAGEQARLFVPFGQLDGALVRRHAGTGIGLALAQRIAAAHGATITVTSAPGEGSRFSVRLPKARQVAPAPPRLPA